MAVPFVQDPVLVPHSWISSLLSSRTENTYKMARPKLRKGNGMIQSGMRAQALVLAEE